MPLKYYVPGSIAFFFIVLALVGRFGLPIAPFAVILFVGETLFAMQIEDHRVPHFIGDLWGAFKKNSHVHHV
jgi:hypothetical protein